MRVLPFLPLLAVAACAAPTNAPSLAPRAAETIDPRLPVPEPVLAAAPSPELVRQLESLVSEAVAGDAEFRPLAERARNLAEQAGPNESESWVVAQQALSAAIAARGRVTRAVADVDALGGDRIERLGGIGAADMKAIRAAAERISEIDRRGAAAIAQVQEQLAH